MGLGSRIFAWLKETAKSVRHGEVICAKCVRVGDGASPGTFGDYSVCPRCCESVSRDTLAFMVEHLPVSCDPARFSYKCAVCRELVDDRAMFFGTHTCSQAAIDRILDSPAGYTAPSSSWH